MSNLETVTATKGAYLAPEAIARDYCAAMLAGRGVKAEAFESAYPGLFFVLHVSGDFGLATNDAGHVLIPALSYWRFGPIMFDAPKRLKLTRTVDGGTRLAAIPTASLVAWTPAQRRACATHCGKLYAPCYSEGKAPCAHCEGEQIDGEIDTSHMSLNGYRYRGYAGQE